MNCLKPKTPKKTSGLLCRIRNMNWRARTALTGLLLSGMTVIQSSVPAYASFKGYDKAASGDIITDKVVDVFGKLATYIGVIIIAAGVVQLIMSIRNEDSDGKHRSALTLGTGIGLLSAGVIIKTVLGL